MFKLPFFPRQKTDPAIAAPAIDQPPNPETSAIPKIEFFQGITEELSNISLRRNPKTGKQSIVMYFEQVAALDRFQSFTGNSAGNVRLLDSEGLISVTPSSFRFLFGGDEGDELRYVQCGIDVYEEAHWDRIMRFLHRYAEAHGFDYQETPPA